MLITPKFLLSPLQYMGFPGGTLGKESACQCRRHKRCGSIPGSGRSPGVEPVPVFLPGKFHGQRSLEGYSPGGCKESEMTERLTLSLSRDTRSEQVISEWRSD